MFDFHEKRKIRTILYSRPVIAVVIALGVLMSFSVYDRYTVAKEMQAKLEVRQNELRELEQRAATLESKVRYLEDERGVEEELRNRFDVVKEGEQVIILVDDKKGDTSPEQSTTSQATESETKEKTFWDFLKFR